jgi:predicted nucleic acid-binding protein
MKVLLDTSVLVSAMLPDHIHHSQARLWMERAKSGTFEFAVSGHSLAEMYSVLTRLPRRPRISPADALQLIQQIYCRTRQSWRSLPRTTRIF